MGACKLCGHPFSRASMNLVLSIKEGSYITKIRLCGKCHSEHMKKGE